MGLCSAPREQRRGQEKTASSSTRKGLDWILEKSSFLKVLSNLATGCQGRHGVLILKGFKSPVDVALGDVSGLGCAGGMI